MSVRRVIVAATGLALLLARFAGAQAPEPTGGHGFDFAFGTWRTHISVLKGTTRGAPVWATMNGTVVTRKVWNGRANLEEIEADGSGGRFEGMTLRLYDPKAREWNLYWSDSSDGTMGVPGVGTFENGQGTFYDQELIGGKMTFVRQRYFDITPTSYRFEQALSHDGGGRWEPNFVASLTRVSQRSTAPKPVSVLPAAQHDFDWQFGSWKTKMSRLEHPLSGSRVWTPPQARVVVSKILERGRANSREISSRRTVGPPRVPRAAPLPAAVGAMVAQLRRQHDGRVRRPAVRHIQERPRDLLRSGGPQRRGRRFGSASPSSTSVRRARATSKHSQTMAANIGRKLKERSH